MEIRCHPPVMGVCSCDERERNMKMHGSRKKIIRTTLLIAAMCGWVLPGVSTADTRKAQKKAVARVNDSYISVEDFRRQFSIAQQQFARQGIPLDEEGMVRLRTDVLEDMIDNQLLFQEGRKSTTSPGQAVTIFRLSFSTT